MKATGIVRAIDKVGRIVIPREIRTKLDLKIHDPIGIFNSDDSIILRKHAVRCALCGESKNLISFHCDKICVSCINNIKGIDSKSFGGVTFTNNR